MRILTICTLLLVALLSWSSSCIARESLTSADWPMFRGPGGRGVAADVNLPIKWSVATGENVAWQSDLPGRGVSGPIVVDGKVFVTASSGLNRERLHVLAFDAETGKQLWHRQFWATGTSMCHETSANAAPTPASDGERVFAFYSSNDVIALDLDGNLLWMRGLELDYPGAGNALGMSSSPVVAGEAVVLQCEAQGNSFVAALERKTGETLWDAERPKAANWCSPIAISAEFSPSGNPAVAVQSGPGIDVYEADSGEVLVSIKTGCETIPSLTFDKYLIAPSNGVRAFDISAPPAATELQPVWQESKLQPGSPSPVAVGDWVYVINRGGVLSAGRINSDEQWKLRLGGQFWATPVVVGDRLYCVNSEGKSFVVQVDAQGEKGTIIGESEFGEDILGTPAVAENGLFVRSHQHLWKIAE